MQPWKSCTDLHPSPQCEEDVEVSPILLARADQHGNQPPPHSTPVWWIGLPPHLTRFPRNSAVAAKLSSLLSTWHRAPGDDKQHLKKFSKSTERGAMRSASPMKRSKLYRIAQGGKFSQKTSRLTLVTFQSIVLALKVRHSCCVEGQKRHGSRISPGAALHQAGKGGLSRTVRGQGTRLNSHLLLN